MRIPWFALKEGAEHYLGFIPSFLSLDDQRPAREQFDDNYQHGGGWRPIEGFTFDKTNGQLDYPEDLPLLPVAACQFREEVIFVYEYGMVCIVQKDGSFEVSRMA